MPVRSAGQQVGRELDPPERQVKRLGERAHGPGLGEARNALDQHVAARQERNDQPFQERTLADNQLFHAFDEPYQTRPCRRDCLDSRCGGIDEMV